MKLRILAVAFLTANAFIGTALADIPGQFVVQQATLTDPVLSTTLTVEAISSFGSSSIQNIGDVDDDNIEDVVVGAQSSFSDSGSISIITLNPDGTQKKVFTYPTSHSAFAGKLSPNPEQFGVGIAVLSKFSKGQNCSKLAVSSRNFPKVYGLSLCKDATNILNAPKLSLESSIDTTKGALSGLGYGALSGQLYFGAMSVIDTIGATRIVSLSTPDQVQVIGGVENAYVGGVLILSVDPTDPAAWVWILKSKVPASFVANNPLLGEVYANSQFGKSVAPVRGLNGKKGIAILAPNDTSAFGAKIGRIHFVTMDATYGTVLTHTTIPGTPDLTSTNTPTSIAASDFNHDGISDLVIGYGAAPGPGGVAKMGGFSVNILDASWSISGTKLYQKNTNGIQNSIGLMANSGLGSMVLASDFDGDGQIDVIAGAGGKKGTTRVAGSIWAFRMKALPWLRKNADVMELSSQQWVPRMISDYLTGNQFICSFIPPEVPVGGTPIATCRFGSGLLECQDTKQNGTATVRVICSDAGNIPATDHFADTLVFGIKVTTANQIPKQIHDVSEILLQEDQAETQALTFSSYYEDPEKGALSYTITKIGTKPDSLLSKIAVENGLLKLKPIALRYGACSLSVVIKDPDGGFITDTLAIRISHVNHPPIARKDSITAYESSFISITATANDEDPDRDPLSIVSGGRSSHGKVVVNGGALEFTPDSFFIGKDTIKYDLLDPSKTTASAIVVVTIVRASDLTRVVRPIPKDVILPESAPILKISYDSLFYNGDFGFKVPVHNPPENMCGSIADITLDTIGRFLIISPKQYKNGECRIVIHQAATMKSDTIFGALMLHITPEVSPYHFAKDTVDASAVKGLRTVYQLKDSIDNDLDTLEYYLLDPSPSWTSVDRSTIVFNPGSSSSDSIISVAVRKKSKTSGQVNQASDTLTMIVYATKLATVHGRKFGDLQVRYQPKENTLIVQGGDQSFRVDVIRANGQTMAILQGGAGETAAARIIGTSGLVYLRVVEGIRRSTYPVLLNK